MVKEKLKRMVAMSDLILVGHSGIITSTGGSVNVDIEVEEVVKGPDDCKRVRIAFQVIGTVSSPELKREDRYIFMLQVRQFEHALFYGLIQDDPNAIIPFNDKIFQEIHTLVADEK